jgi:hypothetical protein
MLKQSRRLLLLLSPFDLPESLQSPADNRSVRAKVAWDFYSIGVDPALFNDKKLIRGLHFETRTSSRRLLPSGEHPGLFVL